MVHKNQERMRERPALPRYRRRSAWMAPSTCWPKMAKGGVLPALRGSRDPGDLGPELERPGPHGSVLGGGDVIAAEREEVVDLVVGREEPLRLAGGFEPLHLPFSSPCRLVRVLGPVVKPLVPAVLDP